MKTLLKSVREFKTKAIQTPIFVSLEVILECIIPFIMAKLIDEMTLGSMEPVIRYGLILIVLGIFSLTFGVLSARCSATASSGFGKNLREDLFFIVQDFSFADIDAFSTSSLITRMTTDVQNVQNAFGMFIRIAVRTPLMMIFSIFMAVRINGQMALIFLGILPLLGIGLISIARHVFPIFRRIFKKYDALNNSVQENIAGIRVVKSFVREDYEIEKFNKASEEVRNDFVGAEKILALNQPMMSFFMYTAMLLVSYIGARFIITSKGSILTTGQLSSLINYGIQILSSMMMLSMVFVMFTMAQESINRIVEVLTHESDLKSPENGIKEVKDGSISFKDVSFKYANTSHQYALFDVDLDIPSGSTVGILGSTGASKTTLIQLISRLYDVTAGSVKVGGVDVREYDLETLRDAVGVVLQKNVLFSGTIKENLRWGKPDATDEEMLHACQLAHADEFIQQFPDKYDTYIEQGGTNVSGGQKQRLCIARALLKNPKIIIFDDSTSAVDTKTDALIQKALREEIPNTTKIIIAQRVSSVEHADKILVMDGGKIVEQGSHEELLKRNGIYREVYDTQTKGKEA